MLCARDPQNDPEYWVQPEEVEPGVFMVVDQDGEPVGDEPGPYSNQIDADNAFRDHQEAAAEASFSEPDDWCEEYPRFYEGRL